MSLPVNPSDIASAIKLGFWIYEHYFVTENRASERFMEFGSDVRFLAKQLRKLANILDDIDERQRARGIRSAGSWDLEKQELVGDFNRTLKQSKKLLEENAQHNTAGFLDTMRFYTVGIEAQANHLRDRLQFHCSKINFLLKPLELELQGRSRRDMDILKRQSRRQMQLLRSLRGDGSTEEQGSRVDCFGLIEVPPRLSERYEAQAVAWKPFTNPEAFPLKETLNSLLYHFNESTMQAAVGYVTLKQYNNLIKSRWILGKLLASLHYQRLGDCLSKNMIDDIEDEVRFEYGRFDEDWDIAQAQAIATLDDSHFKIWIAEEPETMVPTFTDEAPGEIKILQVPLPPQQGYSSQSLHIFRQSDNEYRLIRSSKMNGLDFELPSEKQMINVHHFRFIPFYAVPNSVEPANNVWLCQNHQHQGDVFELKSQQDTFAFQQALTGYAVTHSTKVCWELQQNVHWKMSVKGLWKRGIQGQGWSGLQLWEWNPLSRLGSDIKDSASEEAFRSHRSKSDAQASTMAEVVSALPGGARSIITSPDGPSGSHEIVASSPPKVPVLLLFTVLNGRLSFLHLPLDLDTVVNMESCGCQKEQSTCCTSVLERRSGSKNKKFEMKVYSVRNNSSGLPLYNDWNLLIFGQPGQSRHPEFADLEVIDNISLLNLEFNTSDDRKKFHIAYLQCQRRHREKLDEFDSLRNFLWNLDQKPNLVAQNRRKSTNMASRPSSVAIPPSSPRHEDRRTSTMSAISSSSDEAALGPYPSSAVPSPRPRPLPFAARQPSTGSTSPSFGIPPEKSTFVENPVRVHLPSRTSTAPPNVAQPAISADPRASLVSNSSDEYTWSQPSSRSSRSSIPNRISSSIQQRSPRDDPPQNLQTSPLSSSTARLKRKPLPPNARVPDQHQAPRRVSNSTPEEWSTVASPSSSVAQSSSPNLNTHAYHGVPTRGRPPIETVAEDDEGDLEAEQTPEQALDRSWTGDTLLGRGLSSATYRDNRRYGRKGRAHGVPEEVEEEGNYESYRGKAFADGEVIEGVNPRSRQANEVRDKLGDRVLDLDDDTGHEGFAEKEYVTKSERQFSGRDAFGMKFLSVN